MLDARYLNLDRSGDSQISGYNTEHNNGARWVLPSHERGVEQGPSSADSRKGMLGGHEFGPRSKVANKDQESSAVHHFTGLLPSLVPPTHGLRLQSRNSMPGDRTPESILRYSPGSSTGSFLIGSKGFAIVPPVQSHSMRPRGIEGSVKREVPISAFHSHMDPIPGRQLGYEGPVGIKRILPQPHGQHFKLMPSMEGRSDIGSLGETDQGCKNGEDPPRLNDGSADSASPLDIPPMDRAATIASLLPYHSLYVSDEAMDEVCRKERIEDPEGAARRKRKLSELGESVTLIREKMLDAYPAAATMTLFQQRVNRELALGLEKTRKEIFTINQRRHFLMARMSRGPQAPSKAPAPALTSGGIPTTTPHGLAMVKNRSSHGVAVSPTMGLLLTRPHLAYSMPHRTPGQQQAIAATHQHQLLQPQISATFTSGSIHRSLPACRAPMSSSDGRPTHPQGISNQSTSSLPLPTHAPLARGTTVGGEHLNMVPSVDRGGLLHVGAMGHDRSHYTGELIPADSVAAQMTPSASPLFDGRRSRLHPSQISFSQKRRPPQQLQNIPPSHASGSLPPRPLPRAVIETQAFGSRATAPSTAAAHDVRRHTRLLSACQAYAAAPFVDLHRRDPTPTSSVPPVTHQSLMTARSDGPGPAQTAPRTGAPGIPLGKTIPGPMCTTNSVPRSAPTTGTVSAGPMYHHGPRPPGNAAQDYIIPTTLMGPTHTNGYGIGGGSQVP